MTNNTITAIKGIRVGHYTDSSAMTGCTAVLFDDGAVAGVDVRGSAPGTRETDLLHGCNAVKKINCIMLSGGSAFGLDAASGAMEYLEKQGKGVDTGYAKVPIVPSAVIYDLGVGSASVRPNKENGLFACENASSDIVAKGAVGAATGATLGKGFGQEFAYKSGIGSACIELKGGVKVAALIIVNALGDVYDPDNGKLLAAAKINGNFMPCFDPQLMEKAAFGNTTIGVVATNAELNREEANKLASMAHDGLAMTIKPVHTMLDGDTVFGASTCEIKGYPLMPLLVAAVKATSMAVIDAVKNI
ncbi:MAG: P1 family peptidase [Clostridia bacterium]|nr:P1 family peptidase [Clostridia bacterium]